MKIFPEILNDLKKIYPFVTGIRKFNSMIEFSLDKSNNEKEWFSYHQLPYQAEIYIHSLIKTGAFDE